MIQVADWGDFIGVILSDAVKIAALGVIWYCGLAIRRVSNTAPDKMGVGVRPGKKGEGVETKFSGNTHYAPSVLKTPSF